MKHSEIYDKHSEGRKNFGKKRKTHEGIDREARARRVTFKNYVRELEEELLDLDTEDDTDQTSS